MSLSRHRILKQIDEWLVRLGYLSQIGLLGLGAFGLFYTVIPLYQKAVIDEEIAQKTLQLQRTTESLKQTYGQLRDYIAWSALFAASADCMGLMVPPSVSHSSLTDRQPPWHHVLDVPVENCLLAGVTRYSRLGLLTPPDREYFMSEVKQAAADIDKMRTEALARCIRLAKHPEAAPIPPVDSFTGETQELLREAGYKISASDAAAARVSYAQITVSENYVHRAQARLDQLRALHWPTT